MIIKVFDFLSFSQKERRKANPTGSKHGRKMGSVVDDHSFDLEYLTL